MFLTLPVIPLFHHSIETFKIILLEEIHWYKFPKLFDLFANKSFRLECVYNPNFLAPYVMDNETKQHTVEQIQNLSFDQKQTILDSLQSQPTEQQRQDLSKFLHEFIRRRPDLNWSSFPKTFRQWIQHVV